MNFFEMIPTNTAFVLVAVYLGEEISGGVGGIGPVCGCVNKADSTFFFSKATIFTRVARGFI